MFHAKVKMISRDRVEGLVGHAPDGVSRVRQLQQHRAPTPKELSVAMPGATWVDVCKLAG